MNFIDVNNLVGAWIYVNLNGKLAKVLVRETYDPFGPAPEMLISYDIDGVGQSCWVSIAEYKGPVYL